MNHPESTVYDIVGIGIGPFNLGLAALAQPLVDTGEINAIFFDQRDEFCWHPGMLLDNATIQVPFLADLVTLADPTNPYSFLNYLKLSGRLHRFYIRENFFPLRSEYSNYCAWVDAQLSTTVWGKQVRAVRRDSDTATWLVELTGGDVVRTHHVVSGVGTEPFVPSELANALTATEPSQGLAIHSADYLHHKAELCAAESVVVIGSGQSAAEIYADLLPEAVQQGTRVDWITRSPRFFPMEYTKLTLEMTSPEYAAYLRDLPAAKRQVRSEQNLGLYKGISSETINAIYDLLYRLDLSSQLSNHTALRAGVSARYLNRDNQGLCFELEHTETGTRTTYHSQAAVVCTGYQAVQIPSFLEPSRAHLNLDGQGRLNLAEDFSADASHSLFALNADEHITSLISPDLGMGPWRNSIVLRAITGREVYPVERSIAFQQFGGFENA